MRRLVETRIGGCGCPEEVWEILGFEVTIHFEDGHADCFVDAGDWDVENRHHGPPEISREAAFQWIESWER